MLFFLLFMRSDVMREYERKNLMNLRLWLPIHTDSSFSNPIFNAFTLWYYVVLIVNAVQCKYFCVMSLTARNGWSLLPTSTLYMSTISGSYIKLFKKGQCFHKSRNIFFPSNWLNWFSLLFSTTIINHSVKCSNVGNKGCLKHIYAYKYRCEWNRKVICCSCCFI